MKELATHDLQHLRAAQGWLELGNHLEANAELGKLSSEMWVHPEVLEVRWQIYAKELKWGVCLDIARAITTQDRGRASGWVHLAHAARRANGGTAQIAHDILHSVANEFPQEPIIFYNLACYACQIERVKEARQWLEKAFGTGNAAQLKLLALDEPDLESLWQAIEEL